MPTWNAHAAACPTRLVLDRIADKWAVLLLGLLARDPLRYNRLRREVEGISQKMLSQSLKGLERDGLVRRKAIPHRAGDGLGRLCKGVAAAFCPPTLWGWHALI